MHLWVTTGRCIWRIYDLLQLGSPSGIVDKVGEFRHEI